MKEVAALALGEIGDPRAVEPLITALGDEDYETYIILLIDTLGCAEQAHCEWMGTENSMSSEIARDYFEFIADLGYNMVIV